MSAVCSGSVQQTNASGSSARGERKSTRNEFHRCLISSRIGVESQEAEDKSRGLVRLVHIHNRE